jgi:hypothetical protein
MLKPISIFPALVLAVALLAAGCGGGESTISKAELIKQGDVICEQADESQAGELAAYEQQHAKDLSSASTAAVEEQLIAGVILPSVLTEAEELEALGAPSGEEAKVQAIIAGIEEAAKKAEKAPASIEEGSKSPFNEASKLAREYGFKACAEVI